MADVRGAAGVPLAGAFGYPASPAPTTPLYINLTTGDLYALIGGSVTLVGGPAQAVSAGLTAAGTNQGTALSLTASLNTVTTVAANTGVVLYSAQVNGPPQVVYNGGANTLNVYPPTGGNINQLAANTPIILPINTAATFWRATSTQWVGSRSA